MFVDYLPLILLLETVSVFLWKYNIKEFALLSFFLFGFLLIYFFRKNRYVGILLVFLPVLFFYPLPKFFRIENKEFKNRIVFTTPFYNSKHKGYGLYNKTGVVVYSKQKHNISIGDTVYISGIILENQEDDYDKYLLNSGYPLKIFAFYMIKKGENNGLIFRVKRKIYDNILSWNVHDITKGVSLALLTGDRNYIDEKVKNSFVKSGTIHLLAISGLHIGLIAAIISLFIFWMPINYRNILLIVILGIYVLFINRPSAHRAFLVISFFIVSSLLQRDIKPLRSLIIIALLLILIKPYYVIDKGFIFSFMAYGGIVLSKDIWQGKNFIVKMILVSLFAQLPLIPLISSMNGFINVFSVFHNIILIPLLTPLMILIFLSLFFPFLRIFLDMYVLLYTGYVFNVSEYGVLHLHFGTLLMVIAFYILYLAFFVRKHRKYLVLLGLFLYTLHVFSSLHIKTKTYTNKGLFSVVRIKGDKAFVIGENYWSSNIIKKNGIKEVYYVNR